MKNFPLEASALIIKAILRLLSKSTARISNSSDIRSEPTSPVITGSHTKGVNSIFHFNYYAGLLTQNNRQMTITGNDFSYNGIISNNYPFGYGFSASHRGGLAIDNNSTYIAGNRAFYNYRKGLDAHGGHNISFINNHIKGYVVTGMGSINQAGADPNDPGVRDTSWYMWGRNIKINYNIVENDSLWLDSLSAFCTGNTTVAIQTGSFATHVLAGGTIEVIGNMIYNNNSPISQRAPIFVFINIGGERMDAIKIKNNTIFDVQIDTADYSQDGVIYLNEGTVVPRFVDISNNNIYGIGYNGIKVNFTNSGQSQETVVRFNNNNVQGAFTNPYFCLDENLVANDNTYNHELVENLINKYQGNYYYSFDSDAAADSTEIVTWDMSAYWEHLTTYKIKVLLNDATNSVSAEYNFYAYVGSEDSASVFGSGLIDSVGYRGYALTSLPTIGWTATSEDEKTLKLHFPTTFTRAGMYIDIAGRIPIWKTEN